MSLQYNNNAISNWLGKTADDFWEIVLKPRYVNSYKLEEYDIFKDEYKEMQRKYLEEIWDNLQGILKELKKYKIFYFDIHEENVGYNERNGNIVFFDIGGEIADSNFMFINKLKKIDIDFQGLAKK